MVLATTSKPTLNQIREQGKEFSGGGPHLSLGPVGSTFWAALKANEYPSTTVTVTEIVTNAPPSGGTYALRGKRRAGFRVAVTGAPTGGTFTITSKARSSGTDEAATIQWNQTATGVATQLRTLGCFAEGVCVSGGPLPHRAIYVTPIGFNRGALPKLTANPASLTGGSSPAVSITAIDHPPLHVEGAQGWNLNLLFHGEDAPQANSATGTTVAASTPSLDGRGSVTTQSPSSAREATYYARGGGATSVANVWDLSDDPVFAVSYNPRNAPATQTLRFSPIEDTFTNPFQLSAAMPQGWNQMFVWGTSLSGTTSTTTNASEIAAAQIRLEQPSSNGFVGGPSQISMNFCGVPNRELPVVLLWYDDALQDILDNAYPVMTKYKNLYGTHMLGVVKQWVENAERTVNAFSEWTASPCITLNDLLAPIADGIFTTFNHSDVHGRYQTGADFTITEAAAAALSATEWALIWKPGSNPTTSHVFTLNWAGATGATADIAFDANLRAIQAAIDLVVGTGPTVTASMDYGATAMGNSFGLRLQFSTAVARPTLGGTDAGDFVIHPAWTQAKIEASYRNNAAWMQANGLPGHDIVAYPEGSLGPDVINAMNALEIKLGRVATTIAGTPIMRHQLAASACRLMLPTVTLGSINNVTNWINQVERTGGVLSLMLHFINSGSSAGTLMNTTEYDRLLHYLDENHGKTLMVMSASQYFEYLKEHHGPVVRRNILGSEVGAFA